MDGSHERLNVIENTLERLSQDLKIMRKHKNHINLEVSTSNLEEGLDEIPLAIDLALLPIEKESPSKGSIESLSSRRLSNVNANFVNHHFDPTCKNTVLLNTMRMSIRDLNCMSPMAHDYLPVLQGKEEPLSVEQLCSIGHDLFAMRDWKGAMEVYSKCIPILMQEIDSNKKEGNPMKKQQEDLLLLSYSNRAETCLRLSNYEDALNDATKVKSPQRPIFSNS